MPTHTDQTDTTGTPIAEPKGQMTPQASTDEIFLTPRVLDAAAFSRYTESLQALIRDLDQRSTRLSSTSADTTKLCTVLRQAAKQLEARASAGAALAQRLEAQTTKAESVARVFTDQLGSADDLTRLAETAAARKRTEIADALESALAGLDTRLAGGIEKANARAADAESRAAIAETKLAELSRRLDAITEQADTIAARAADAVQDAESRADRAASNAIEATEQLRLVADTITETAARNTAELEQRLGPFRDLLSNAGAIIGTPESPGSLANAIETAKTQHATLTQSNTQAAANIETAEQARAELSGTINAAAESLESLAQHKATLTASIESDIESLSDELSPIEHTAAALRRTIDDLVNRTHELHTEIATIGQPAATQTQSHTPPTDAQLTEFKHATDSITERALTQVEQAAQWLESLADQARQIQA